MTAHRRSNLITSRRRVADEGEDDDADAASADYESQSEISILTGAEDSIDQGSERSNPSSPRAPTKQAAGPTVQRKQVNGKPAHRREISTSKPSARPTFANTADTNAMMNGLNVTATEGEDEVMQFDAAAEGKAGKRQPDTAGSPPTAPNQRQAAAKVAAPHGTGTTAQPHESSNRASNDPAYVPNRGGFFMHDQRNDNVGRGENGISGRGQGRGRGGFGGGAAFGNARGPADRTESRWNHDLHDSLSNAPAHNTRQADRYGRAYPPSQSQRAPTKPPSMSKSTTLGLQSMRVMLLGMDAAITYEKVPVKQHVRLPDLRPPLRRDKPVRVSIQDQAPKYIFPSVERSFIFIPRAQRPNQQRLKGRGYYSPFGSRRNSIYGGGSHYTSSVAMSRRSSMARDGFMSPIDAVSSRPPFGAPGGTMKPVVKLPTAPRNSGPTTPGAGEVPLGSGASNAHAENVPSYPLPSRPAFRENRPTHIPMHQPRPQKTVSVATIESPPVRMHAPEQQQEQPFHHQVPAHMSGQVQQSDRTSAYPAPAAPVNGYIPAEQQIPYQQHPSLQPQTPTSAVGSGVDQALNVNAQQFHPGQSQMVYPSPYAIPNFYYYPPSDPQAMQFSGSPMQAPPMYVQATPQGNYLVPMLAPPQPQAQLDTPTEARQGTYAQESNGTVFFYDQSQYAGQAVDTNGMQPGSYQEQVNGAGMMKADPGQQMYFPPAPAPMMYYGQQ